MIFPIELIHPIPDPLKEIPSPPTQLYYQGSPKARALLDRLPSQGLAIVGTRNPRERSTLWLKNQIQVLGNFLKNQEPSQKLIILSGLARGIDTTAHLCALEANLPTVAIVGSGLDRCYPEVNTQLRDRILAADGLIVSEFPPGTTLYRSHFLRRNRIIAGWARATWIVEAGYRSGALNTAKWAREANRLCFAIPCFPGDPSLAGNQVLLDRDHALPYWGTHSLGAAWLELATCLSSSLPLGPALPKTPRLVHSPTEAALIHQVKFTTECQGSVSLHELLDWALQKNWEAQTFYEILEKLVKSGLIHQSDSRFLI